MKKFKKKKHYYLVFDKLNLMWYKEQGMGATNSIELAGRWTKKQKIICRYMKNLTFIKIYEI